MASEPGIQKHIQNVHLDSGFRPLVGAEMTLI